MKASQRVPVPPAQHHEATARDSLHGTCDMIGTNSVPMRYIEFLAVLSLSGEQFRHLSAVHAVVFVMCRFAGPVVLAAE